MRTLLLILFFASSLTIFAQEKLTTFILVRHAEKVTDGSKNPELSDEGKKRAIGLAESLTNTSIAAIYSTDFTRTKSTVEPLAKSKSLEVKIYDPFKKEDIERILNEHKGRTVVICGHSNNIPGIANYLSGTDAMKDFVDSEYGNLLVVTVSSIGTASVTWLRF